MITLEKVSVHLRGHLVLECIDFKLVAGSVVGLIGRNGAGKSTLLRTCVGERIPTSGRIFLFGQPLAAWPPRKRARHIAVLSQDQPLNFPFRVRTVVGWGAWPHTVTPEQTSAMVAELLDLFDLGALADRPYTDLSGGERQRVHLARVFLQVFGAYPTGRACLLLDEPTNHLDLVHQRQLIVLLRRFQRAGGATLIASHDIPFLCTVADRLAVLDRARIVAEGPLPKVFQSGDVQRALGVSFCEASLPQGNGEYTPVLIPRFFALDQNHTSEVQSDA
ncbi:MAG: hemin import ATP-binding protein HmuV [Candidatus Binatia bacterium]|nr:MAG: hemin import ATP-binding protein HmuV [Candidatus Binatia bacterium]